MVMLQQYRSLLNVAPKRLALLHYIKEMWSLILGLEPCYLEEYVSAFTLFQQIRAGKSHNNSFGYVLFKNNVALYLLFPYGSLCQ
jgi:hypothetical protein